MTKISSGSSIGETVLAIVRPYIPDFVRKRFTLKFALILVAMGLVVGVSGVAATQSFSGQIEDNVEQEYHDLAAQQANVVETWIQRNAIAVKVISENEVLTATGSGVATNMNEYLARTGASLYGMESMYVINRSDNGTSVVASPQLPDGQSLVDGPRAWLGSLNLSDLFVGSARVSDVHNVEGTPVTAFVSPVPQTNNRYLVIEFSTASLTNALSPGENSKRFTRVVNADGTIQISSDDRRLFESYGDAKHVQAAMTGLGIDLNAGPNPSVLDDPYVVSYAPIDVTGMSVEWGILVHEPRSSAFSQVRTIFRWGTIVTVGGVLLIALLGAVIGFTTSRDLNRLRRKVEEMEEGNLEVDIHSNRIDSIGRLYDGFASMRDALRQQIDEAEQARKEAEVSRAEAMEMNEYLQEKAEEYSETMEACAAGDLTQRMEADGENDAMDQIATDFNEMIEDLEKTTGQLKHFADEVEEAGSVVETSAESVRDASEQVAESIQHISDDAHDQQERLEELSVAIDEAIEQFERVAEESDVDVEESVDRLRDVADTINDLVELTDKMMAESENVAGAAEEQAAELNSVSQKARDLTRYAGPLKDVLDSFETEEEHEFYFPTGPGSSPTDDE